MTNSEAESTVVRSGSRVFLAEATKSVLFFFGIIWFARTVDIAEIGVFFLFQALLYALSIFADFGICGALEKRISQGERPDDVLATALLLKLIPLSLIVTAVLLLRSSLEWYVGADIAVALAVGLVVLEASKVSTHTLKGELRVGELAALHLLHGVVWVSLGGALVSVGLGAEALIYALIVGYAGILLLGWNRQTTKIGAPSWAAGRSLSDYSKYNVISSIGTNAYSWIDLLIIGLFLTQADVAAYEIAWQITVFVLLFSRSLATATLPHVSNLNSVGATDQIERMLPGLITLSLILVIPAVAGTVVLSEQLLGQLFGDEYRFAWLVLIVLMGEKLVQAPNQIVRDALHGLDRPDLPARAMTVAIPLNFVLNVAFVWVFGLLGAAVATAIAFSVYAVMQVVYLSQLLTLRVEWRAISWCVVATVIMTLVIEFVRTLLPVDSMLSLVSLVTLGALTYGLVLGAYSPVRSKVIVTVRGTLS